MSDKGHQRHFERAPAVSAIPPIATKSLHCDKWRSGPQGDIAPSGDTLIVRTEAAQRYRVYFTSALTHSSPSRWQGQICFATNTGAIDAGRRSLISSIRLQPVRATAS